MATELPSALREAALIPRTATAIAGGSLLLAMAWLGGWWWVTLLGGVALVGAMEFARLHPSLPREAGAAVIGGAAAIVAAALWAPDGIAVWVLGAAAAVLLGAGILPWVVSGTSLPPWAQRPWITAAWGAAYLGLPAGVLLRWRLAEPLAPVVWFLVIIWASDTAAYFIGLAAGRHRLAPRVSPGKSWEGAVAGVVAAVGVGTAAAQAFGLGPGAGAVMGVVISVTAQAGDLFESAMKRRAGVKDSGALLPGHGGILDRFDGVFLAAPVAYLVVKVWGS